jgi:hypothetical protein
MQKRVISLAFIYFLDKAYFLTLVSFYLMIYCEKSFLYYTKTQKYPTNSLRNRTPKPSSSRVLVDKLSVQFLPMFML